MSYPYQQPPQLPGEFRMASGGFGRMAAPFIAMLVFFFLITLLLGAILTNNTVAGIGIGAACTAIMVGVLYSKFRRMKAGTVVRFSPYGVELADAMGFRLRLRWPDITHVGQVLTQMANLKSVGADGGVKVSVGAMNSPTAARRSPSRSAASTRTGSTARWAPGCGCTGRTCLSRCPRRPTRDHRGINRLRYTRNEGSS